MHEAQESASTGINTAAVWAGLAWSWWDISGYEGREGRERSSQRCPSLGQKGGRAHRVLVGMVILVVSRM